jgi:hypothetical protein
LFRSGEFTPQDRADAVPAALTFEAVTFVPELTLSVALVGTLLALFDTTSSVATSLVERWVGRVCLLLKIF